MILNIAMLLFALYIYSCTSTAHKMITPATTPRQMYVHHTPMYMVPPPPTPPPGPQSGSNCPTTIIYSMYVQYMYSYSAFLSIHDKQHHEILFKYLKRRELCIQLHISIIGAVVFLCWFAATRPHHYKYKQQ